MLAAEHRTSEKYAGEVLPFDILEIPDYSPDSYIAALEYAAEKGYFVVVLDSLSHAWMGKGGALEMVDRFAAKEKSSFNAWRHVTPRHNALIEAMLAAPFHLIATMRAKTEWVVEKDEKSGKSIPRKIGLAPVQRDGMEYEFDMVGDLDTEARWNITKTRYSRYFGLVIDKPDENLGAELCAWLDGGESPYQSPIGPAASPVTAPSAVTAIAPAPPRAAASPKRVLLEEIGAIAREVGVQPCARLVASAGGKDEPQLGADLDRLRLYLRIHRATSALGGEVVARPIVGEPWGKSVGELTRDAELLDYEVASQRAASEALEEDPLAVENAGTAGDQPAVPASTSTPEDCAPMAATSSGVQPLPRPAPSDAPTTAPATPAPASRPAVAEPSPAVASSPAPTSAAPSRRDTLAARVVGHYRDPAKLRRAIAVALADDGLYRFELRPVDPMSELRELEDAARAAAIAEMGDWTRLTIDGERLWTLAHRVSEGGVLIGVDLRYIGPVDALTA